MQYALPEPDSAGGKAGGGTGTVVSLTLQEDEGRDHAARKGGCQSPTHLGPVEGEAAVRSCACKAPQNPFLWTVG